jgi:sulfatase modifying factor 1
VVCILQSRAIAALHRPATIAAMKRLASWVVLLAACGSVSQTAPMDAAPDSPADAVADAPPPEFRSCASLAATCGSPGTDDCCTSPELPGGSSFRIYTLNAAKTQITGQDAAFSVHDFRLDKYLVTVGRFRAFVAAGRGTQAAPPHDGDGAHKNVAGSGWLAAWDENLPTNAVAQATGIACDAKFQTWTPGSGDNENRPMNCVSWYEAMAFCIWDGGYLPTEAELTYASAGGDQLRMYPWSVPATAMPLDATYASYSPDDGASMSNCPGDGVPACDLTDILRVGSDPKGDGRWLQSDLGGNLREWALDWFTTPYTVPCMDCAAINTATDRVQRGGSFDDDAASMSATSRLHAGPDKHDHSFGFRCARAP